MKGDWGTTENNREAKYYKLTAAGSPGAHGRTIRLAPVRRAVDLVLVAES